MTLIKLQIDASGKIYQVVDKTIILIDEAIYDRRKHPDSQVKNR